MTNKNYVDKYGRLACVVYGFSKWSVFVNEGNGTRWVKDYKTEKGVEKYMASSGWLELPHFISEEGARSLRTARDNYGNKVRYKWLYTMIAERM